MGAEDWGFEYDWDRMYDDGIPYSSPFYIEKPSHCYHCSAKIFFRLNLSNNSVPYDWHKTSIHKCSPLHDFSEFINES